MISCENVVSPWRQTAPTGRLLFADGTHIDAVGVGAVGSAVGEICFNTTMTGYQEVLTDPSYAGQIVMFTFPHIGNVGVNDEDIEILNPGAHTPAVGTILRADITAPANHRANANFNDWLSRRNIVGISGIDTRALTTHIRRGGMCGAVIAHAPDGVFDMSAMAQALTAWPGLEGADLAREVSCGQSRSWDESVWDLAQGYRHRQQDNGHVVVVDYGVKRNILRLLADQGFRVTIVPATSDADYVLSHAPDGVFLSNGPGDPQATGQYAVPMIQKIIDAGLPMFGICLGHQMLALAVGGKTEKMHQGHHGANHPVKDFTTGKVEITAMNHGFTVDSGSLPEHIEQTHISLFDGSNCGIRIKDKPIFSVQYHPEASPGPQDSHYLFARFADEIRTHRARRG